MLRIKVEVVPHGIESASEVLDTIWVENDGSGIPGGPDSGGVGNYNVFPPGETLEHLHVVDYPSMYAIGRVEGLPRDDRHRLILAELALSVVNEAIDKKVEPGVATAACPQIVRKVERPEPPEPAGGFNNTGHGSDGEGQ